LVDTGVEKYSNYQWMKSIEKNYNRRFGTAFSQISPTSSSHHPAAAAVITIISYSFIITTSS